MILQAVTNWAICDEPDCTRLNFYIKKDMNEPSNTNTIPIILDNTNEGIPEAKNDDNLVSDDVNITDSFSIAHVKTMSNFMY